MTVPDSQKHLDADLAPERVRRFAERVAELPPETVAMLAGKFAGDRSPEFDNGVLAGLSMGYQLVPPMSDQQREAGTYIVYVCKLIADKVGP